MNNSINDKIIEYSNIKIKNEKVKRRYIIYDNFKGILIFTVVFAHFLWNYSQKYKNSLSRKLVVFIYFFHMEGLIFISGFLSSDNSINPINANKLLILYYIFNFSFSVIIHFYNNEKIDFLYPKYSYWYLLSLYTWRILIKYIYIIKFIFVISIIITILEGYWYCFSNVLSIRRTICFFPYFLVGYIIRKKGKFHKFLQWRKGWIKFFIFFSLFISFLILFIIYIYNNQISYKSLLMLPYNENNTLRIRMIILIISSTMILFFLLLIPNVEIPLFHQWGKNSLYIYLFHRIFIIIVDNNLFNQKKFSNHIIEFSLLFTIIILFIFGSDFLNKKCNSILNYIYQNLLEFNYKGKIISFSFFLLFICLLLINPITLFMNKKNIIQKSSSIQSKNLKENIKVKLNDSIRISYVGDLILLKDQVISAKNNITGKYEFDEIFQYTYKHFHESDLSIGVYEGPSAGNNTNYSTSNYGDGIPLYLNFPDEFAESVKNAGINLVTTANNHLLDKKVEGAMRTLDILDKYNIAHVGSYRNQQEKDKITILNIKGIKLAFLAYTSKMNNIKMDSLYEKYKYITRIIPDKKNRYYNQIFEDMKNDFINAKKFSPDIIIVLAHMGTQFLHDTDKFQNEWNKIFIDLGADIILGDHSHAIQPLQFINNVLIVNSPGNFANSYRKKDGDATALIDIYISKQNKKVIGASVIPMYTKEIRSKYFSAIPIYNLINNKSILLTKNERRRVDEIQLMSTKILLGKQIGINEAKEFYFFINNSFYDL